MKRQITGVLCLISLLVVSTANAALVAMGDYTTDTDTGLDWYDLGLTSGLSVNQVLVLTGAGGSLEGWSIANVDQVHQLMTNAGWIGAFDPSNDLNVGFVANFNNLTSSSTMNPFGDISGFTNDPADDLSQIMGLVDDPIDTHSSYTLSGPVSLDFSEQNTGTFLYQVSAVPLPASLWLFGSGLVGLVGWARRGVKK